MYVYFIIIVYKYWAILVTFANNMLLKMSFTIIPLFIFTKLDTLNEIAVGKNMNTFKISILDRH